MSNFQTRKLEELRENFNWEEIFGKDSGAQKAIESFLSAALKEQMEEIMKIINKEHREYLLSEERKEDCGCNDRDMEHYRIGVDDVCQSIMQRTVESGLLDNNE